MTTRVNYNGSHKKKECAIDLHGNTSENTHTHTHIYIILDIGINEIIQDSKVLNSLE